MRSKNTGGLLLLAALLTCLAVPGAPGDPETALGVQAVVDRYLEAAGGRAAHDAIRSRVTKGTFTIAGMDSSGPVEIYQAPPNFLFRLKSEFGTLATGVLDEGAWTMSPFEGARILDVAAELDARRRTALNAFLDWKQWFTTAAFAGQERVGDTPCDKVVMTPREGPSTAHYFAQDSGLLLKSETGAGYSVFEDYRTVDGVSLPHRIRMKHGPAIFEIVIQEIRHNVDVPAGTFAIPEAIMALVRGEDEGSGTK